MTRWVFLAFLLFFVAITRGHFASTDEIAVFQQTRSLWEHHDLDVTPMINTRPGPDGRWYAAYNVGQSIAALPFYGAGKLASRALAAHPIATALLAGPQIANGPIQWGGQVEIFFVNLFNAFVTALLCALFFSFSLRLGATPRSALIATIFLGVSSHIAGFSACFFQHSLEALMLFASFYLLFQEASPRRRFGAGLFATFAFLVRFQTVVLLPSLVLYLWWGIRRRGGRVIAESVPFFAPILAGLVAQVLVNGHKFGAYNLVGAYGNHHFDASLLVTLFGFLFSPGESLFVFTPLLLLLPLYGRHFARQRSAEMFCIGALAISYLLFHGKYFAWHGQWCFGPRYLVATVPFLLLPLALWWDSAPLRWRTIAVGLAIAGTFVEVLHVAVNFSYVFHAENYEGYNPPFGYLFIPQASQIVAHYRALLAFDNRVDMWLVNVHRAFGWGWTLTLFLPLAAGCALSGWQIRRHLRRS
jgi:hypothetical protein